MKNKSEENKNENKKYDFVKYTDEYMDKTKNNYTSTMGYDFIEFLGVFDKNNNKIHLNIHSHVTRGSDEHYKYYDMLHDMLLKEGTIDKIKKVNEENKND